MVIYNLMVISVCIGPSQRQGRTPEPWLISLYISGAPDLPKNYTMQMQRTRYN